MSKFDELLGAIQNMSQNMSQDATLQKSMPAEGNADDDKIAAAAADGDPDADGDGKADVGHAEPDGDEGAGEGNGDGDGDEASMGKSFAFTLENGDVVEAIDGTKLVKSLIQRVEDTEGSMAKALGAAVDLIGKQGEMIKSLQDQVAALGTAGRGRKTVISVSEKPAVGDMKKSMGSEPEGITPTAFMAKALAAQASGKITGLDVARAETALNKGMPVPQDIVARVTQ